MGEDRLRVAMARPWAAVSWKPYLAKLYAGPRTADFGECRDRIMASLHWPGYPKAFSRTTRTNHDSAKARLADVMAPVLVVMGGQDPRLPSLASGGRLDRPRPGREVVMVPEAGHYPQSQRPDTTTGVVRHFLESVTRA